MNKIPLLIFFWAGGAVSGPIEEWDRFEKQVRDQTVAKDSLKKEFSVVYAPLKEYCRRFPFSAQDQWVFPLRGYGPRDVGKNGFAPGSYYGGSSIKGYDFFDGNRHGGHPAYDIFIHDTNDDCMDDRTGGPVAVAAPLDLVVISINAQWKKSSGLRGGKYVWALSPSEDLLFYFAHLDSVLVTAGAFCRAGERIGTVGRTGKNAAPRTSKTHLHMMVLKVAVATAGDTLKPLDFLPRVIKTIASHNGNR